MSDQTDGAGRSGDDLSDELLTQLCDERPGISHGLARNLRPSEIVGMAREVARCRVETAARDAEIEALRATLDALAPDGDDATTLRERYVQHRSEKAELDRLRVETAAIRALRCPDNFNAMAAQGWTVAMLTVLRILDGAGALGEQETT